MHHLHISKHKNKNSFIHPFSDQNPTPKLTFWYNTQRHQQAVMEQLQQNQVALQEEVSQARSQTGPLIKTIQVVARGQEIMAKM